MTNYLDAARTRFSFALWAPESDPAGMWVAVFACLPPRQYARTFTDQKAAEAWLTTTPHNCPLRPGTPVGGKHFIILSDEFIARVHELQDRARRELYRLETAYESAQAHAERVVDRCYPGMPPEALQAFLGVGNVEFDAMMNGWHCDTLFNAGFETNEQDLVSLNWHGRELERMAHGEWSVYSRLRSRASGPQKQKQKQRRKEKGKDPAQGALGEVVVAQASTENPY
jgi:hypothetical protein